MKLTRMALEQVMFPHPAVIETKPALGERTRLQWNGGSCVEYTRTLHFWLNIFQLKMTQYPAEDKFLLLPQFPRTWLFEFPHHISKSWFKKEMCVLLCFCSVAPGLIACFPASLLVIASTAKWVHSAKEPRCHCTSRTHHIFSILPWLFAMALNLLQSPFHWQRSKLDFSGIFHWHHRSVCKLSSMRRYGLAVPSAP